jgi:nitrate/nitrite transporter NarK
VAGIFGMGNIGTAISARLAPQLAKNSGWHTVFLVFAVVLFVTAVAFYFVAQDAPLPPGPTKTMAQRLSILKENRLVWLFSLYYFLTFGCFVAFGLYLPKLLTDLYTLDRIDAGNRTAIVEGQVLVVAFLFIGQLWLVTEALYELLSGRSDTLGWLTLLSFVGFLVALIVWRWPRRHLER